MTHGTTRSRIIHIMWHRGFHNILIWALALHSCPRSEGAVSHDTHNMIDPNQPQTRINFLFGIKLHKIALAFLPLYYQNILPSSRRLLSVCCDDGRDTLVTCDTWSRDCHALCHEYCLRARGNYSQKLPPCSGNWFELINKNTQAARKPLRCSHYACVSRASSHLLF